MYIRMCECMAVHRACDIECTLDIHYTYVHIHPYVYVYMYMYICLCEYELYIACSAR